MKTIAVYITAHGYGHGARTCDWVLTWHARNPESKIIIVSSLSFSFISSRLIGVPFEHRDLAFDVGMVQKDSVQIDLEGTWDLLEELYTYRKSLLNEERAFLRARGVSLVLADIPAIPLLAAKRKEFRRWL